MLINNKFLNLSIDLSILKCYNYFRTQRKAVRTINRNILYSYIKREGFTIAVFSDLLGMNESTFYKKCREKGTSFNITEIKLIVKLLNIRKSDIMPIFFDEFT